MRLFVTLAVLVISAILSPFVQGFLTGGKIAYSEVIKSHPLPAELTTPFSIPVGELTLAIEELGDNLGIQLSSQKNPLLVFVDVTRDADAITMYWGVAPSLRNRLSSLGKSAEAQGRTRLVSVTDRLSPLPKLANSLNIEIGISPGVLAKWFEQPFLLSAAAAQISPDDETIKNLANIAAAYTARKYSYSDIQDRSSWLRLVGGSVQLITIFVTLSSLGLIGASLVVRGLVAVSETLTELIPFTGFFGTLLGMQDALNIFGIADISDDASKALNLGQIGGKLGLAVTTTIFAIICFGIVMILFAIVQAVLPKEQPEVSG